MTMVLRGEIATRRDPPEAEQAGAYYRQALALTEALGMRPLQAHCHQGLGTLYTATGQREAGPHRVSYGHGNVPGYGDDVLAS